MTDQERQVSLWTCACSTDAPVTCIVCGNPIRPQEVVRATALGKRAYTHGDPCAAKFIQEHDALLELLSRQFARER